MEIVIHSLGMPFDGNTVALQSLGGSESAAYYLARALAEAGHSVSVWTSKPNPAPMVDGVRYVFCGEASQHYPLGKTFEFYARNTPHDVLIIQRTPLAFHKKFAAKVCIWQLHDLAQGRFKHLAMGGLWQIDFVTCVSEWHKEQVSKTLDIPLDRIRVVRNAVDHSLYMRGGEPRVTIAGEDEVPGRYDSPPVAVDGGLIPGDVKILMPRKKFVLLYQSRPERGFQHLVRPGGIMDRVRHLPVHLFYCAYDNTVSQMVQFYGELAQQAAALPNVSCLGALTKSMLAEVQKKADLLIYPTEFEEVSCITAMECAVAGLPMITSRHGALPETCSEEGCRLFDLKDDIADEDTFVAWLENTFKDDKSYPPTLQHMRQAQVEHSAPTWSLVAKDLIDRVKEEFCKKVWKDNDWTHGRILRHAIEHSDIHFARWYIDMYASDPETEYDRITRSAKDEISRMYAFTESDEAYQEHYDLHQGKYYDENEDIVIGENVTGTTRFRGVQNFIANEMIKRTTDENPSPALRIIDYGCAHGHYVIPLAKAFPTCEFFGYDLSERAITAANKWAVKEGLKNVHFARIDPAKPLHYYINAVDVIIAGEVLEHVRKPIALLEEFRHLLSPNGQIIGTTPIGRWEHSGTVAFRTGREHLAFYEKADLQEMFAGHEFEILVAPAVYDQSEAPMASYVWMLRPKSTTVLFLYPNYSRKLTNYAPRETISACLIVKDGESTLRKCVESFIDWVDEIIIGVDPSTKDGTLDIISGLQLDFPNRTICSYYLIDTVLNMGFDAARNDTVSEACGDWILWCDADEEVFHPGALHKLTRSSVHPAFGFGQVHYSLEPESVLTTDYPMRMFRNNGKIKFYGVVHEHPETAPGDAVQYAVVRPEVKFLHAGYTTENVRRERYKRNLPLLVRDRQLYPARKLNTFLWLRDLTQGMVFEQQQSGVILPHHLEQAEKGVELFEQMVDSKIPPKMISDSMQYYSACVQTLNTGFESKMDIEIACQIAPDLATKIGVQGRFHTRAFYQRVVAYLLEESTKTYESKYF